MVEADPRVEGRTYVFEETGEEIPYALFVPSDYDPSVSSPLIVGLHGLGRPYDWLMGYEGIVDRAEEGGFLMVTPLGYHPRGWYGSRGPGVPPMRDENAAELPSNLGELSERDVMNVLALVRNEFNVDPDRIYLWGHSMGGAGTYHLAAEHPDLWAGLAVAAPAPFVEPDEQLPRFRDIPVLVLHGDDDSVVSVSRSREWVAAMRELGMEHLYVEVEGGDHSRFINAAPDVVAKLFAFFEIVRKNQRGPLGDRGGVRASGASDAGDRPSQAGPSGSAPSQASQAAGAQTAPDPEVERHEFTTSDGVRLHYARLGDEGTPVILIHGFGGQAQTWLDNGIAHTLARNHRVVVPDMRGHGRSEGPRAGDMALDVIELMDHLAMERAHVHGFSMGGSIVAQLMARVPDRLITAAFGGSGVRETEEWTEYVPPDAEGEDPYNEQAVEMYLERRAAAREPFGGWEAETEEAEALEEEGLPDRPGPGPAELDLTAIEFPVLAIVGEYDDHKERTHRLWRELRNFQSIMLPGRGHLSSYYPGVIPDAYLDGLVTFIDAHDPGAHDPGG